MTDHVHVTTGRLDASGLRFAIVAARFNEPIVERLVAGALDTLQRHGAAPADLQLVWVPGAFEIPLIARQVADAGGVDAVITLGAVVRGATPHFEFVATEAARGAAAVAHELAIPVTFGVLTTDTWEQAVERAGGKLGNKGTEAAMSAIEMADLHRQLKSPPPGGASTAGS